MNPSFRSGVFRLILTLIAALAVPHGVARTYGDWQQTHFGVSWATPSIAGDTADPDHDGWPNAVEYAFGQDPNAPSTPLWKTERAGSRQIIYFQRMDAPDLNLYIERSSILQPGSWDVIATSFNGQPFNLLDPGYAFSELNLGGGRYEMTLKENNPVSTRFFRIRCVPATPISISVDPASVTRSIGQTRSFTALVTYSDGFMEDLTAQVTWSSGNPAIATVSNASGNEGIATAVGVGNTTILATYGTLSDSGTFNVNPIVVTAISVTPANPNRAVGETQPFTATATYSDNSTGDVTTLATWSSSMPSVASISNAAASEGLSTAISTGTTTITATLGMVSGSTTLTVGPPIVVSIIVTPANPSVAVGNTQAFNATGVFSDSSTQDLTTLVTWSSANTGMAAISNAAGSEGLATAVSAGTTTITAHLGTVSGNTQITTTGP